MPKTKELTDKEYIFVMEYLKDYNGAKAARRAGYCPDKPQNSRYEAQRILTKDHIKAFITQHKEDLAKEVNISEKDVLALCQEIMMAKPSDFYDREQLGIRINPNTPNQRAILSLHVSTILKDNGDELISECLKLRDPLKAAERVCKLLGMDEQDDVPDREFNVTVNIVRGRDGKEKVEVHKP